MNVSTCLTVTVGDYCTDTFSSLEGIGQGENLNPTFFNITINDIPTYFDPSCDPVKLTKERINCLLYADDLILLSNSTESLQNCVDKLPTFCHDAEILDTTKS